MQTIFTEVLIVGSGIAGLMAGIEARERGCAARLLDKGLIGRSGCSVSAEQIAAVIPGQATLDSPQAHLRDTLQAGRGINDIKLAERMVADAPAAIHRLEQAGVSFDRTPAGRLCLEEMNGHRFPRSLLHGDTTGRAITTALRNHARRRGVALRPDVLVTALLASGRRAAGAVGVDFASGAPVVFRAKSVVLACGGAGQLYPLTTNPVQATGDGYILGFQAGAALRDMEFYQFYPAAVIHPASLRGFILGISQHGRLLNGRGERFMVRYAAREMEKATRDTLTLAVFREIRAGGGSPAGGVYLDATGLRAETYHRYRDALRVCRRHGVDLRRGPVEVAPAAHYCMGGIRIDAEGGTGVGGLYAAGEVAGGVHGANRLGNNSLLDAAVFGARAGASAAAWARQEPLPDPDRGSIDREVERVSEAAGRGPRRYAPLEIRRRLQAVMAGGVGIVRHRAGLERARAELEELQAAFDRQTGVAPGRLLFNRQLADFLETGFLLRLARIMVLAAAARPESRGAHYREDHPLPDDAHWLGSNEIELIGGKPVLRFVPAGPAGTAPARPAGQEEAI